MMYYVIGLCILAVVDHYVRESDYLHEAVENFTDIIKVLNKEYYFIYGPSISLISLGWHNAQYPVYRIEYKSKTSGAYVSKEVSIEVFLQTDIEREYKAAFEELRNGQVDIVSVSEI